MKIALAYSRQWPVDFANQVDYLMKPMVTFSESYLCWIRLSPLAHFLSSFSRPRFRLRVFLPLAFPNLGLPRMYSITKILAW